MTKKIEWKDELQSVDATARQIKITEPIENIKFISIDNLEREIIHMDEQIANLEDRKLEMVAELDEVKTALKIDVVEVIEK